MEILDELSRAIDNIHKAVMETSREMHVKKALSFISMINYDLHYVKDGNASGNIIINKFYLVKAIDETDEARRVIIRSTSAKSLVDVKLAYHDASRHLEKAIEALKT